MPKFQICSVVEHTLSVQGSMGFDSRAGHIGTVSSTVRLKAFLKFST